MYGLPPDFDSTIFLGKRLDRICFAQYMIAFYFVDELSAESLALSDDLQEELTVNLQSSFAFQKSDDIPVRQAPPINSSEVMSSIGETVVTAVSSQDGTIILTFKDGAVLQFLDDSTQYESYSIIAGDKSVIV